jgi:hypothetical protein
LVALLNTHYHMLFGCLVVWLVVLVVLCELVVLLNTHYHMLFGCMLVRQTAWPNETLAAPMHSR